MHRPRRTMLETSTFPTARIVAALWLLAAAVLTGCAAPDRRTTESVPLLAVSNMKHAPFSSWSDDGRPVGIEVELVADAAGSLGRSVVWQEHAFGDLLRLLASGDADVAAATIGITPARSRLVAFTKPYFVTSIVALVRAGDGEPKRLADLRGKVVGADPGTTAFPAAQQLAGVTVRTEVDPGGNWGQLLRSGEIDAMVIDATDRERLQEQAGVPIIRIEEALAEERFALAVRLDAHELRQRLNTAIDRHLAAQH